MAEIGLLGLPLPAAHGGFGGGAMDAMCVMEAIGDALIVEPWLATVALGAQLVARGGSDEQQQRMLPAVARGTARRSRSRTPSPTRATRSRMSPRAHAPTTPAT